MTLCKAKVRTPLIIKLLHNLSNNLSDGLNGFDVIFCLLVRLLQVLEGKPNLMDK